MADIKIKKKKVLRLKPIGLIIIILFILFVVAISRAIINLPTKQIFITGTSTISDNEIITALDIKDYPKIFKLNPKKMEKTLESMLLISDAHVKRSLFGKVTIEIKEEKILFYNKSIDKLVLSNKESIDNNIKVTNIPTLVNYVPDTIYEELITGLNKVDCDIVSSISEIEYSPSTNSDGKVIDEGRFILRMNDGNTVMMNTVNIKRLNNYFVIYASIGEEKGTFYLDSIAEEQIFFKSYKSQEEDEEKESDKDENELSDTNGENNN